MKEGLVPNVVGMGLEDALHVLEELKLNVRVVGSGLVLKQSLVKGTIIVPGQNHKGLIKADTWEQIERVILRLKDATALQN